MWKENKLFDDIGVFHHYEDYTLSFTLFRQFVEFIRRLEAAIEIMNDVVEQAAAKLVNRRSSE